MRCQAQEVRHAHDVAEVAHKTLLTKVNSAVEVRYKNFIKYKPVIIGKESPYSFFEYVKLYKRQLKRPNGYCPETTCCYHYKTKVDQADHYIQAHCCTALFACLNLGCYNRSDSRYALIEHMIQCNKYTDENSE